MDIATKICIYIFMGLIFLGALIELMNGPETKKAVKSTLRRIWSTVICTGAFLSGVADSIGYLVVILLIIGFLIINPWALLLLFFLG